MNIKLINTLICVGFMGVSCTIPYMETKSERNRQASEARNNDLYHEKYKPYVKALILSGVYHAPGALQTLGRPLSLHESYGSSRWSYSRPPEHEGLRPTSVTLVFDNRDILTSVWLNIPEIDEMESIRYSTGFAQK